MAGYKTKQKDKLKKKLNKVKQKKSEYQLNLHKEQEQSTILRRKKKDLEDQLSHQKKETERLRTEVQSLQRNDGRLTNSVENGKEGRRKREVGGKTKSAKKRQFPSSLAFLLGIIMLAIIMDKLLYLRP